MPKIFYCCRCGLRIAKNEGVHSRYTGKSYCRDEAACARRVRRNERLQAHDQH